MNATPGGPMDMGDIVAGAWNIYRRTPLAWLAVTLVGVAVGFALQWLGQAQTSLSTEPTSEELRDALPWIVPITIGIILVDLYTHVALVVGAVNVLRGGRLSATAAYAGAARLLAPILGVLAIFAAAFIAWMFASAIAIAIAAVVPALAVVVGVLVVAAAVYVVVSWILAVQVIVAEGNGPSKALTRSRELVKGAWWRTLGISVAIVLLAFLPGFVISRMTGAVGIEWVSAAGAAVAGGLVAPFTAVAQTLLYGDLRARKGERPFVPALREAP